MKHRYFEGSALLIALGLLGCSNRQDSAKPVATDDGTSLPLRAPRDVTRRAVLSSARVNVVSPASRVVADVELPRHANGATRVTEHATGMTAAFSLRDATRAKGVERDGVVTYAKGGPDGSDVVHLPGAAGTEDFVVFERRPSQEVLRYAVDVGDAAGLRLVAETLELLDGTGTPRLRMSAPYVLDRHGARHPARVTLEDCAADRDARAPWGRAVTPPGRADCTVRIAFGGEEALGYPVVVDPAWAATAGTMVAARSRHTATLLANGKVLLVGGVTAGAAGSVLASAELFDPATRTFAATGSLVAGRSEHVAVRLDSGDVFVATGANDGGIVGSVELYSPTTGKFTAGGAQGPRKGARAVLLADKRVLISGGVDLDDKVVDDVFTWNPANQQFLPAPLMQSKRTGHVMIALGAETTLVAGGALSLALGDVAGAETLGATGGWDSVGSLSSARRDIEGVLLDPSRRVLVAGGYDSVAKKVLDTSQYLGDASTAWSSPKKLGEARVFHTLTALPGGNALVVGGLSDASDPASALASVELYDGSTDAYLPTAALAAARARHTATLLSDGRVLVAGGDGPGGPVKTAELYTPVAKGAACESQAECATGHCVDGVCCESACDDACSGCSLASTGKANGTCALALAGKDPHGDCADDGSPACTKNGLCDGKGACASYAAKSCTPSACTEDDDCTSEHCADGICCSAACDGECEACTKARTGGTDGTCAPVAEDTDPDAECGTLGTGVCRGPSTCGGESECKASTTGKACKPAGCQDSVTLAAAATCSTAGECEAETASCDPYTCDAKAVACRTECADDAECAEGALCKDGVCERKPDGEACDAANECTSGFCVDGVCCDVACDGQCEACDGTAGTCRAVSGEPLGDREPCTGDAPCAGKCNGLLREFCVYPSTETSCGASSCEDGTETRDLCNGSGECVQGATKACFPFTCGDEACKASCSSQDDCEPGRVCSSGQCVVGSTPTCPDGGTGSDCEPAAPADDGGCGCRTPPNTHSPAQDARRAVPALLALSLFVRRRYRRRIIGTRESPTGR